MAWLSVGLKNEAIRLLKKHVRRKKCELLILNAFIEDAGGDQKEIIDTVPATSDTLDAALDMVFLQDVLSTLTPLQQKIIMGTVIGGLTDREMAISLKRSQSTVQKAKKRALTNLRKIIKKESTPGF